MAPVFWDAEGLINIDYLKEEKYVNSKYFIQLLVLLKDTIHKRFDTNEKVIAATEAYFVNKDKYKILPRRMDQSLRICRLLLRPHFFQMNAKLAGDLLVLLYYISR